MKRRLFLGGPLDGQVREVQPGAVTYMYVDPTWGFEKVVYAAKRLPSDPRRRHVVVMCVDPLATGEQLLSALAKAAGVDVES